MSSPAVLNLEDRSQTVAAVEAEVAAYLTQHVTAARAMGGEYGRLLEEIHDLVRTGGKRLRPLLAVWSYAGFGGRGTDMICRVAASQELFHAGILMHDDIIDRDTTRWGVPNITGRYTAKLQSTITPAHARHVADSYALLAGDICLDLAYKRLLSGGAGAAETLQALDLMHETLFVLVGGELLDVAASLQPLPDLTPTTLLSICEYKTAAYSFCLPLEIGAIMAGARQSTQRLHELGIELGIAYQLQDDLLGIFGEEARLGKPVLSDLREGKRTVLMRLTYQHTTANGRQFLETWLGNARATSQHLAKLQQIVQECGARTMVEAYIAAHQAKARQLCATMEWQPPYAQKLETLFSGLVGRQA